MTGPEERTEQRQGRAAALVAPAVSLGLLLLLWAAVAGPASVLSPSGRRRTFGTPFQPEAVTHERRARGTWRSSPRTSGRPATCPGSAT